MFKVLLVDDEPTALYGLQVAIPWERLGFEVAGCASNGEEALVRIEEIHPDLVVTDVQMPRMDGIALAFWIHENYPETTVIIVSGYDEFDYAQSALKAGVSEYLLKPLKRQQWEETFQKIHTQMLFRRKRAENFANMEKELQRYRPVIKNQYLSELAQGRNFQEEPYLRLKALGTSLKNKPYYLVCFDTDVPYAQAVQRENIDLMHIYQRDAVMLRLSELGDSECFSREDRWYYIVEQPEEHIEFEELLETACRDAIADFSGMWDFGVSAGISFRYDSLDRLPSARRDCDLALECRLTGGGENCIWAEQIGALTGSGISFQALHLDGVMNNLRLLETEKVQAMLRKQFKRLQKDGAASGQFYCLANIILMELYNLAVLNGADKALGSEIQGRLAEIPQYKKISDLLDFCLEMIDTALTRLKKQTKTNNKEIVSRISAYISEHLADDLTLQMVADHVHVSRNYLCSIFRREFNETFVSYITRLRMNRAMELLREGHMKTYEVAAAVGYGDYVYFSQVFKKQTGVTTTEYRKSFIVETGETGSE